jgi:hypothetical protein
MYKRLLLPLNNSAIHPTTRTHILKLFPHHHNVFLPSIHQPSYPPKPTNPHPHTPTYNTIHISILTIASTALFAPLINPIAAPEHESITKRQAFHHPTCPELKFVKILGQKIGRKIGRKKAVIPFVTRPAKPSVPAIGNQIKCEAPILEH